MALQLKLNELIASDRNAGNCLIDIEGSTRKELNILKNFYVQLAELAKKETKLH